MSENKDKNAIVLPFGKHKGSTVAELLVRDPAYAEWIVNQGWVAERFAELHAAILSRGASSDDSPEHNAIQVRFLDETFRLACVLSDERFLSVAKEMIRRNSSSALCDGKILTTVKFEQRGVDVSITVGFGDEYPAYFDETTCTMRIYPMNVEIKPTLGDDFPSVMRQMARLRCSTLVIGDYTGRAVSVPQLRQMFGANGHTLLFVRDIEAEFANARAELE